MDKLSAMTTFVAVVEAGSFTRAADALTLPTARVSQRIADLERHLGVRLLNRTTRTLHLTEDGQAYLAKCQSILQQISEAEGSLKHGLAKPRGKLRVEALVSVARWIIAPKLPTFVASYPHISVRLGSSDHVRHILEEGIDCSIRSGAMASSSLIARRVADVRLGLYAAPRYLERCGPITHPGDLEALRRISWFSSAKNPFNWRLVTALESVELREPVDLGFDNPDVAIAACMADGGVCPAAPFAVADYVRAGLLVPVLPAWSFEARPIHVVYSSKKYLSARVRSFVDWTVELMTTHPTLQMTPSELADSLITQNPD